MPALDQWEKRLKLYFTRRLHMIGEVPLSRQEMEDIASGVRSCIKRQGLPQASEILDTNYPYCFLTFLTAFGAYNTLRDYWGALGEEIGVTREHLFNHGWHRRYLEKVKKLGLRHFVGEDPARPYVTTIRYHGGIPVYSLPDYFRYFLMPSIERPELSEVTARQALDVLLKTSYHVDSPVINFLENSGALGEEFFESCRTMARHYRKQQEVLTASELDLPERVVQAFEAFMTEELAEADRGRKLRLRKPVLLFTPYLEQAHLYIRLPEQEVPLRYAESRIEWRVQPSGDITLSHVCSIKMQRQHMVIEGELLPINARPQVIHASLISIDLKDSSEDVLRRWVIPLMPHPKAVQFVAFRADGTALAPGDPLPAEELLLVYPGDLDLEVEGSSQSSQRIGRLYDAWDGWQAHGWDLSKSWSLQFTREGQAVGEPIPVAGKLPVPEFLGEPTRFSVDPGGTPLYIGEAPVLRIPIRQDVSVGRELSRWKIDIRSSWMARPELQESFRLTRFQDLVEINDGWVKFPLGYIFAMDSAGTYSVCLSGPIEEDIEFRFRLWPKLTVMGWKKALFPDSGGADWQTLSLLLPSGARCEPQAGAEGVEVKDNGYAWEVKVSPETVRADLNLVLTKDGELVRVPIFIPIPRLRWALTLGQELGQLRWTTRLIQMALEQVVQNDVGSLHVCMPGLNSAFCLNLQVIESGDQETVRQEESFQKTPFALEWLRLPLGKISGTLRHSSSMVRLELLYRASRAEDDIHIPLVLLSRKLEISDVDLQETGELNWQLTWKELYPVKNRRVLLQPAWQPWQPALEVKIPDNNSGDLLLPDMSLPPARYYLHFYAAPLDDPALTEIPDDVAPIVIDLCVPEERLAEIIRLEWEANHSQNHDMLFRYTLEAACIYADIGNFKKRDEKLSELATQCNHINNVNLFLGLLRWVNRHLGEDNMNRRFFRRFLYKPELVQSILQRYHRGQPELRSYLAYVPELKNLYTKSAYLIARYTDDPLILSTCLRQLIEKQDDDLLPLMIEMISSARLSNQDAVDLLVKDTAWSLKAFLTIPSDVTRNQLLADLLSRPNISTSILPPEASRMLIDDAFPHLTDQAQRKRLLKVLVEQGQQDSYRSLVSRAALSSLLSNADVDELVAINPKLAIQALRDAPASETRQAWLARLTRDYPKFSGIIATGTRVRTRAGVAEITAIKKGGESVENASLLDPDVVIHLVCGAGVQSEKITVNVSHQILRFENCKEVFTCGHCNFVHPNRRVLDQHHREKHPYQNLSIGSTLAQIKISVDEIEIL